MSVAMILILVHFLPEVTLKEGSQNLVLLLFPLGLECGSIKDLTSEKEVMKAIKTPLASMQYGSEDFLAELVAQACSKSSLHAIYCLFHTELLENPLESTKEQCILVFISIFDSNVSSLFPPLDRHFQFCLHTICDPL